MSVAAAVKLGAEAATDAAQWEPIPCGGGESFIKPTKKVVGHLSFGALGVATGSTLKIGPTPLLVAVPRSGLVIVQEAALRATDTRSPLSYESVPVEQYYVEKRAGSFPGGYNGDASESPYLQPFTNIAVVWPFGEPPKPKTPDQVFAEKLESGDVPILVPKFDRYPQNVYCSQEQRLASLEF